MKQNNQKSNLKRAQVGRIASLMLGSVFTGSLMAMGPVLAAPTAANNGSLNKVAASTPLAEAVKAQPTTIAPATTPAANQVAQASDVSGNWAEPFIKVLVEKDIIKGYPDGTFRPDQPITRAEFAALLNKAFDLKPIREARRFKDVPKNYWAADVIQKAYRSGFLAGYPGSFGPKQNLLRIQGLVSLVNGSKLEPAGSLDLNSVFGDAAQVPSYGQNALIAATQKCVAVSVEYDSSRLPGGNFGPNTVATRADVAAYIHQVLVGAGRLTALDASSPGNKYIASCPQGTYVTSITGNPAANVPVTADEAIAKLSIPGQTPAIVGSGSVGTYPVGGLGTPTAFGGNSGFFIGAGYQNVTRPNIYNGVTSPKNPEAWAYSAGIGLGDPRNALGLEAVATTYTGSTRGNAGIFDNGGVSFKVNKLLGDNLAIAGGYENAITFGNNSGGFGTRDGGVNGGRTGYGVISAVLNPDANQGFFSNTTLSVGAGAGRFRTVGDIRNGRDTINIFGSLGTNLFSNVSVVADWNGQDLGVGLPITIPFGGGSSFQITPALVDLANSETGGSRFVVSGGLGFNF
ncbi:S-layer homology domain-containing protein [Chamaesiphon sp. VAR_69_metabat_338]|uniref:S-layer homology domain-containing protein n=1 Tax=Chamaesiphon sp. VAR_69_metabat_338 TaxID=2964704 RepID=UPI00286E7548|nr:S-layer homology domain-containing protein [Chamaesiphon sp. VAR_69_metabat_338]